jgi:primase-polymerase (primpol)-like protein
MNLKRAGARSCSPRCRKRLSRRRVFPADLIGADRWLRWELRDGRKVPLRADGAGCASSTDPATWTSYTAAARSKIGAGLGFALGDGIGCWDFDHCLIDGVLDPAIADRIDAIHAPLFTEVSQSGEGLHVFVSAPEQPAQVKAGVEFYTHSRFIAMTGEIFRR